MKTMLTVQMVVVTVVVVVDSSWADSWCDGLADYGIIPVFCDDFDTYCTNPDPAIGQCPREPGEASRSVGQLHGAWPKTSINTHLAWPDDCPPIDPNAADITFEDNQSLLTSAPFGGRNTNNGDEAGHVGQTTASLVPGIQSKWPNDPAYNTVYGTDESPLVLRFDMSSGLRDAGALFRSMGYLEVGYESGTCVPKQPNGGDLDPEVTPTDWIKVGTDDGTGTGCLDCYHMCPSPNYSVHVWWPTICQSYEARTVSPACPPVPEDKIHTVLAIGAVAWLDPNPCHCETPGNQRPQNYHLSFFDGWKWRSLRAGQFPGSGDFTLGAKYDTVTLTIKTYAVDIEHTARVWSGGVLQPPATSTATGIPRKYLGPFNVLRSGTSSSCELRNDEYRCMEWGSTRAKRTSEGERCDGGTPLHEPDGSKFVSVDNVALLDGTPGTFSLDGACCMGDGTCEVTSSEACDVAGGLFAGSATLCTETTCTGACCSPNSACTETATHLCAGVFQGLGTNCATTDCPCPVPFADMDDDGDVDQNDFGVLQTCFTGTGGGILDGVCNCFDRDNNGAGDGDVDEDDVMAFDVCASGPDILANPTCGD